MLVLGAGSGVSTFAVQLARQAGARVLVTSSSAEKIERARSSAPTRGSTTPRATGRTRCSSSQAAGVDVVLDSVGSTWPDSLRCLRRGGRAVVFGATGGGQVDARRAPLLSRAPLAPRHDDGKPERFRRASSTPCERGTWAPVIDSVRPLAEAAAAHERMEAGEHFGKLVLSVA